MKHTRLCFNRDSSSQVEFVKKGEKKYGNILRQRKRNRSRVIDAAVMQEASLAVSALGQDIATLKMVKTGKLQGWYSQSCEFY